jgi:beta-catenin-like protein 1
VSDLQHPNTNLGVFENLASQQSTAEVIVKQTNILSWLIQRIKTRESPITQNKQYSAELLAILLQASPSNRQTFVKLEGVDNILQLLSPYRKRDPVKDGDEEELVENLFDVLTCIVDEHEGKEKFVENEGVELMLIMLREGKMAKMRALRVLDHAVGGGQHGIHVCERIVEAAGLKTIFGNFMKKV